MAEPYRSEDYTESKVGTSGTGGSGIYPDHDLEGEAPTDASPKAGVRVGAGVDRAQDGAERGNTPRASDAGVGHEDADEDRG